LVENVVFIGVDKGRNIADHCKHIKLIAFNGVIGQEDVMQLEIEEMVAQTTHHFVCLHVVHVQNIQVVKTIVEGLTDLETQVDHRIENPHFLELNHSHKVLQFSCPRTHTL